MRTKRKKMKVAPPPPPVCNKSATPLLRKAPPPPPLRSKLAPAPPQSDIMPPQLPMTTPPKRKKHSIDCVRNRVQTESTPNFSKPEPFNLTDGADAKHDTYHDEHPTYYESGFVDFTFVDGYFKATYNTKNNIHINEDIKIINNIKAEPIKSDYSLEENYNNCTEFPISSENKYLEKSLHVNEIISDDSHIDAVCEVAKKNVQDNGHLNEAPPEEVTALALDTPRASVDSCPKLTEFTNINMLGHLNEAPSEEVTALALDTPRASVDSCPKLTEFTNINMLGHLNEAPSEEVTALALDTPRASLDSCPKLTEFTNINMLGHLNEAPPEEVTVVALDTPRASLDSCPELTEFTNINMIGHLNEAPPEEVTVVALDTPRTSLDSCPELTEFTNINMLGHLNEAPPEEVTAVALDTPRASLDSCPIIENREDSLPTFPNIYSSYPLDDSKSSKPSIESQGMNELSLNEEAIIYSKSSKPFIELQGMNELLLNEEAVIENSVVVSSLNIHNVRAKSENVPSITLNNTINDNFVSEPSQINISYDNSSSKNCDNFMNSSIACTEPSHVTNTNNRKAFISDSKSIYKLFTPPVFQPYNSSAKPWSKLTTIVASRTKPVEFKLTNVLPNSKINNDFIYTKPDESFSSSSNRKVDINWPEITPPILNLKASVKNVTPKEERKNSNTGHEMAPYTVFTSDGGKIANEFEISRDNLSKGIVDTDQKASYIDVVINYKDNEAPNADTYPKHVRQPSPMCVSSNYNAVWSQTETPSDEEITSKQKSCNNNDQIDIFSDVPSRPFGIAAVSPRKHVPETFHNKNIQQNFNEFAKHMLANDYTWVETTNNTERIRGVPKDEEDHILSYFDHVIEEGVTEKNEEFGVDWSKCSEQPYLDTVSVNAEQNIERAVSTIEQHIPQWVADEIPRTTEPINTSPHDANVLLSKASEERVRNEWHDDSCTQHGRDVECSISKSDVTASGIDETIVYDSSHFQEIEVVLKKQLGSLGIRLELIRDKNRKMVAVAQVMPGGAAEEAGTILPGDRLLDVNGERVEDSLQETVRLFRVGPSVVQLRLLRPSRHERRRGCVAPEEMGSTVSRHSEKGLGRRSQSSGNLAPLPRNKVQYVNSTGGNTTKLCGSLPNHLDRNDDVPENNNEDELRAKNMRNVELRLQTLLPPPQGTKNGEALQLLLPPPPLFHDPINDQGYGSERSPEDENPPLLPQFPFIAREAVFEVQLNKGSRGLGLSVTGGVDSTEPWPGLVRVKRLFPHQPAWQDGRLAPGDVLLEANGTQLTGLSNYEALEVLRTATSLVTLRVCRPPAGTGLTSVAPEEVEPPLAPPRHRTAPLPPIKKPPVRTPVSDDDDDESSTNSLLRPVSEQGEFEISLTKVAGSLGFTLRKEDESVLGHYVRALVREPAVSDGRVRPGDRIVAVNGTDISPMSHEEAVAFLRQCGETVTLRLYRDKAQTPIAALSPTEGCKTFPRSRPLLRKEAIDMLSDIAGRKMAAPQDTGRQRRASEGHPPAPVPTPSAVGPSPSGTSPRRRRLARTPPSPVTDSVGQHNGIGNPVADVLEETGRASLELSLKALASLETNASDSTPRERPSSLDLSTPSSLRKHKFLFSSPPESATFSEFGDEDDSGSGVIAGLSPPNEYPGPSSLVSQPASMPIITDRELVPFSYRNPAYQSAAERPVTVVGEEGTPSQLCPVQASPSTAVSDQDIPRRVFGQEGPQGLIKWKGIVFTPENEDLPKTPSSVTSSVPSKSKSATPTTPKPFVKLEDREGQVLTVELTRGWNSRLGFTLHEGEEGKTLIKAIYPDSVAHRDGRLKQGDHVVMVNEESIEHLPTNEVIDLVRKIRGTVAITVLRPLDSR